MGLEGLGRLLNPTACFTLFHSFTLLSPTQATRPGGGKGGRAEPLASPEKTRLGVQLGRGSARLLDMTKAEEGLVGKGLQPLASPEKTQTARRG